MFSYKIATLIPSYRLTVRTLDFHSKDVGSIPASLIINSITTSTKNFILNSSNNRPTSKSGAVSYSYISLFNPSSIKNITLYHRNVNINNTAKSFRSSFRNYKILVKQSYLMSAWFYYYSNNTLRTKKVKGFVTLPCRQSKHTATKAPMAHKTYSQEQFLIKYYFLVFTMESNSFSQKSTNSINKSLLIANQFHKLPNFNATNLFVIYKVRSWFNSSDKTFFNLKKF